MSDQSTNKISVFLCKIQAAIIQFELIELSPIPHEYKTLQQELYSTTEFSSFYECLHRFLNSAQHSYSPPQYGLVAVPAVPVDNCVSILDLEWPEIDGNQLATEFHLIQLKLINTFASTGRAIIDLPKAHMTKIQEGEETADGTGIVIGCNENIGECILRSIRNTDGSPSKQVFPTLGGLKKFSPTNENEWSYVQYIMEGNSEIEEKFGYLPLDKALSGDSISRIYDFLCSEGKVPGRALSPCEILTRALEKKDLYCEKTLDFFCRLLGTEISNFALESLPTTGIYLVGGYLNLIKDFLTKSEGPFMSGYLGKGSSVNQKLAKFPIYLVEKENLVMDGCLFELKKMAFGN